MAYKHNKSWRLRNVAKRNKQRKRYYNQFPSRGGYRRWTITEADYILTSKKPDSYLHFILRRSIQAIQNKRCQLNKEDKIR